MYFVFYLYILELDTMVGWEAAYLGAVIFLLHLATN